MEKEELIENLAKSQEKSLNCVDSKLQDLKRSISETRKTAYRPLLKKVKQDQAEESWQRQAV